MLIKKGHELFKTTRLVDKMGKIVPMVQEWDTEKQEAVIIIGGRNLENGVFRATVIEGPDLAKATVHLPGCYLIYNETKEKVPEAVLNVGN